MGMLNYNEESFDDRIERFKKRTLAFKYDDDYEGLTTVSTDESNEDDRDECVICLSEFSVHNPVMPTLCSCGENKAKFHYPCLLIWLEKKNTCPACDQTLFYQVRITILNQLLTPSIL
jgi:hypothetical protein